MIAENEIVLTYLLQLMAERGILDKLAFKGGTCLRKMFIGSGGRFSTDLDFTRVAFGVNERSTEPKNAQPRAHTKRQRRVRSVRGKSGRLVWRSQKGSLTPRYSGGSGTVTPARAHQHMSPLQTVTPYGHSNCIYGTPPAALHPTTHCRGCSSGRWGRTQHRLNGDLVHRSIGGSRGSLERWLERS